MSRNGSAAVGDVDDQDWASFRSDDPDWLASRLGNNTALVESGAGRIAWCVVRNALTRVAGRATVGALLCLIERVRRKDTGPGT